MSNNHFEKFLKQLSSEIKTLKEDVRPPSSKQEILTEETEVERLARYLSTSQKRNKNVEKEHETLISTSTKNDTIPAKPANIEANRWQDPLRENFVTHEEMRKHYTEFLQRIQTKLSTIGGSGEVNLRNLDDVDRSTIGPNRHLAYNPTTKKFFFEDVITAEVVGDNETIEINDNQISVVNLPNSDIGPIQSLHFDKSANNNYIEEGTLSWSISDDTLNIHHANNVIQQVGQETYALVRNKTGTTIPNGTVVRFAGAENNGTARLLVAPFLADGSFTSLYVLGVTTQDIDDGQQGLVASWGKVRDLDTSSFNVGDILYVSPNDAGKFTNIKPTAPNNVIAVAAVLKKDATEGEIFVRPAIEQDKDYGRFSVNTDLTIATANTAYVVDFTTTEISNGISLGTPTSRIVVSNSGYYQFDISAQVDAIGQIFSSGTMYIWLRKNGVDIPGSTRKQGVLAAAPSLSFGYVFTLSLDANDYVEIAYAADSTFVFFNADTPTAFAPSTTAVAVKVSQVQQ